MSNTSQSKKPYKKRKPNGNSGNDQPRAFFHIPSASSDSTNAIDGSSESSATGLSEAELYLLSVRAEEASLPAFTKALNPYALVLTEPVQLSGVVSQLEPNPSPTVIGPSASPRHPFLPSEAWRSSFLLHFHNLRQNLQAIPYGSGKRTSIILPRASDESAWCLFIFGAKQRRSADLAVTEAVFIPTSRDTPYSVQEIDEETALNERIKIDEWELGAELEEQHNEDEMDEGYDQEEELEEQMNYRAEEGGNSPEEMLERFDPEKHLPKEPSISILKAMSDKTVIYLLKHITSWIIDNPYNLPRTRSPSISPILAHWSFSLLTRLDAHLLSGESLSDLRSLARACLAVIERQLELHTADQGEPNVIKPSQHDSQQEEDERMACWMIWELVVEVWKQKDLRQEEQALFK